MKRFFNLLNMILLGVFFLVACAEATDSAELSDKTAVRDRNHCEGSPDVGIWYCTYYCTSPFDLWEMEYGTVKVAYRPLCSDAPGDFRKYDASDPEVIDFHLRQIADAKIDFLLFELSPGGLGGYRLQGENNICPISVKNAREVCKRIKVWNDDEQNEWKLQYAVCGGCHPDVWDNQPGFPAGLCMEDTARDVYDSFLNNPEYGGADNYYHLNGKPLLVFWGWPDSISNHWANYGGEKTYGNRFSLRPASGCHYGEYGWNIAPSGTVLNPEVEVVSPGWGHYARAEPPYVYRRNGDFYRECWEKVLKYPLPQIVMVTTFNDYWENTAVWTADTANLTDADKWCEKDGQLNPSMYWDMTKYYIDKMRSKSEARDKRNVKGMPLMIPGSGQRVPLQLSPPGTKGGAKFTADFNITEITVLCPNWANTDSDMKFHLYQWDTDYDTTIAAKPIWTDAKTGIGYPDNGNIGFVIDDGVAPPGTYLWILEGLNSTPGFWAESNAAIGDDPDAVFFHEGKSIKESIVSSVYGKP